jgi:two-component system, NtrC family, nitrogen regulation response regulator NtrX
LFFSKKNTKILNNTIDPIQWFFVPYVLIIDDEREICRSLKGVLGDEGYTVKTAQDTESAWELVGQKAPDLILLDVWFGKGQSDGLHLLDRLRQGYPLIPVIMISGHATLDLAVQAVKKGAVDFLEKPIDLDRLLPCVQRALEDFRRRHLVGHPFALAPNLIKTWPMALDGRLQKAAASDARLLLVGEPGLRKGRLAYTLALASARGQAPLAMVNAERLNQLPIELLVGQEKEGSSLTLGVFEPLQGGTCIVQDVHKLGLEGQKFLAGLFQNASILRQGGTSPIALNVRWIFTADPSFIDDSSKAKFVPGFYDRLTPFVHTIRPLREERRLLQSWVDVIMAEVCADVNIPTPPAIEDTFLSQLMAHHWPHNLRELANVLEYALLRASGAILNASHLPWSHQPPMAESTSSVYRLPLKMARAVFEWNYVNAQLAATEGNMTRAAEIIGMERSALHRKMKALEHAAKQASI